MRTALLVSIIALVLPASALAAPTSTQITSPSAPSFVTVDANHPSTLHIAGTTSGGSGDVDIRCYSGSKSTMVDDLIPVTNGAFSLDLAVTEALLNTVGTNPTPYCVLRAVPAGTTPAAPPGQASTWQGPEVGFGKSEYLRVGPGNDPTPADTAYDYFRASAQAAAYNDYDSAGTCGLCDTYLFKPGTFDQSNPIWFANAAIYERIQDVIPYKRSAAQIDGVDAYSGGSAHMASLETSANFPAVSYSEHVDPATGDLTIDEVDPYAICAPQPGVYPPTLASCSSFQKVAQLDRHITQFNHGAQVAIVDNWSSLDGQAHKLNVFYDETIASANYTKAGHEALWNLTWTPDGFKSYKAGDQWPAPDFGANTILVKSDGATGPAGDGMNPIGAVTYASPPDTLWMRQPVDSTHSVGRWQAEYEPLIPASGHTTITQVYSSGFKLADVQGLAHDAEQRAHAPAIAITSPDDGGATQDATAHVTGTASAPDGSPNVTVNGVAAPVAADGTWGADVPLADGANKLSATVTNSIGVTATASRTVTRNPAAPATPPATQPTPVPAKSPSCRVPKLAGRTLRAAKVRLRKAHCRLGKVTRKASARRRPGRVLATKPHAGRVRPAGTRIRVVVSKSV